jgi:serine/threonine protein phosphatase PrpC
VPTSDNYKSMLFGVFDGHGGKEVAEFARENFKNNFSK